MSTHGASGGRWKGGSTAVRALLAVALLAACTSPAPQTPQPATVAAAVTVEPELVDDRIPPPAPARVHEPRSWPFDVLHYTIRVGLDFERTAIEGSVDVRLRAREPGLTELPLDAVGLTIASVREEGRGDLGFTVDDGSLRIALAGPMPVDRDTRIVVRYAGTPERGLFFNLPLPGDPAGPRQAFTQGECEDTRHWMPCHDFPDDFATHELHVSVPAGMHVVAAGERVGVTPAEGGREVWHYRMDQPHVSYLITLVAGDYVVIREQSPVPLEYVVEPRDAPHAQRSLRDTADVLRFFSAYTGVAYPYPRYAQTTVRDYMFGGMENISATTLTDRTIHPPDWEPARSSRGLVAHEAAHQWFGDLVTCADWSHIWLNEGFATYFDALFTEHAEGEDAFALEIRGNRHGALGEFDRDRRPVVSRRYADPFDLFDGHAYAGGAARLHMLRDLLGDERFRAAVGAYLEEHRGRPVRTEDLEAAASQAAGQDLKWWFDQWLRGPGYPKVKVRSRWDEAAGELELTVEQTQEAKGGVPSAFRFPLDVAFDGRDGAVETRRFDIDARSATLRVALPSQPRFVRPDPRTVLLARFDCERSPEEWGSLVGLDPNPSGRVDAAEALGGIAGDDKRPVEVREAAEEAVTRALRSEHLGAVREVLVRQLGRRRSPKGRDAAVAELADEDLRVRVAAADVLGEFDVDPVAAQALREAVAKGNDLVKAAALRSLARIHSDDAYALALAHVEVPGWQSSVRVGALQALADLGDERAFPILVTHAAPESDPVARPAALEGLGRMGVGRPEYRDAVLVHLTDPHRDVRSAAARALESLADPQAIGPLVAAFRRERWHRTRDTLRNAIRRCRQAAVDAGVAASVEVARAVALREEHAARRAELKALREKAKAGGDGGPSKEEVAAAEKDVARLRKELDDVGVGPAPEPPPAVPAAAGTTD